MTIKKAIPFILAMAGTLGGGAASAQDWYSALHVGKGWKQPAHMDFNAPSFRHPSVGLVVDPTYEADLDYDSGWGIGGALGRSFGNWRLEGELGYRKSDIGGHKNTRCMSEGQDCNRNENAPDPIDILGQAKLLTGSLNLYYDLPVDWVVNPYVGVGAGMTRAVKRIEATAMEMFARMLCPDSGDPCERSGKNVDWDASWQTMAGVKRSFNDRWEAALGWRYTDLKGVGFELADSDDEGESSFLGGDPLMVKKNGLHSVELTLIRRF